jgi:hypothetical protein
MNCPLLAGVLCKLASPGRPPVSDLRLQRLGIRTERNVLKGEAGAKEALSQYPVNSTKAPTPPSFVSRPARGPSTSWKFATN